MEPRENFICFNCKHNIPGKPGCEAFPDGIPEEIMMTNKHDKPLKDQENDLVYEPIKTPYP